MSIIAMNACGSRADDAVASAREAEPMLQVFFVADEDVHVLDDRLSVATACSRPPDAFQSFSRKFRSNDTTAPRALAARMPSMINSGVDGPSAAKMPPLWKPADAAVEDGVPVEVAGRELRGGLMTPVVEHDRRPDAVPAVAVDRRHVRSAGAVMGEAFVEGPHAHRLHALGNQIADG
jgi:hypothetical protein